VSCQPSIRCPFRVGVLRRLPDMPASRAWWLPSAVVRYGDGCMRMPSSLGNIVPGFSPETLSFARKQDESWTSTKGFGRARSCEKMNLFCVPMTRRVSRLGLGDTLPVLLNPVRPSRSNTNINDVGHGLMLRPSMSTRLNFLAAASEKRASPPLAAWWTK